MGSRSGQAQRRRARPVRPGAPPEQAIFEPAQHLLVTDDPLQAEAFGCALADVWRSFAPHLAREPTDLPPVIHGLAATRRPEGLAILRGLSAVLDDLDAARARRAADDMVDSGVPEPGWARYVGQAVVTEAWLMSHALGDGENVILMCRYPDGHAHTLAIYIDHNLGSLVKDAFVGPPELVDQFRALIADEPDTTIEAVPAAEAAARVRTALERNDAAIPPIQTETWPEIRPLVEARLASMPLGEPAPDYPETSPRERALLVDDFLASPEGAAWRDDVEAREIAEHLVSFRCDYGDGRPLRWSGVLVEIVLTDWFPRKVAGSPSTFAKVPDVLGCWVRYAGRRLALRSALVEETLGAVDQYAGVLSQLVADPSTWGPAKAVVQGMLAAGVDLADGAAVERFIDELNAEAVTPYPGVGEPFDWRGIPEDVRSRVEEIVAHCDRVCGQALTAEYADLARRLVAKLARKRPTPLRRGNPRVWAGGVLYALGQVNFLFDANSQPHLPGKRLADLVGVSTSTAAAKASMVRDAVRLHHFDEEFTRPEVLAALRW